MSAVLSLWPKYPESGRAPSAHTLGCVTTGRGRKHYRPRSIQKDAVMDMGVDRAREHLRLNIAAKADVIGGRLGMGHAHRVLLDDRAFVQIGGHVMRRGPIL